MKKKLFITGLFILNIVMMFSIWFQEGDVDIHGTILFENPIAVTCMIMSLIGIWIHHHSSGTIITIGWLGFLFMQIYECLTWHIRMYGGGFDLGLSLEMCEFSFYVAVLLCGITYLIYRCLKNNEYRKEYEYNLKTTSW